MEGLDGYIWMSVTAISLNSNRIVLLLQNIDQRVRVDKRNRHISNITGSYSPTSWSNFPVTP